MAAQDIIAIAIGISAFLIGCRGRYYVSLCCALILIGEIASHLAYPDRYQDAMWLIGAGFATLQRDSAMLLGLLLGWLVFRFRRKTTPPTTPEPAPR